MRLPSIRKPRTQIIQLATSADTSVPVRALSETAARALEEESWSVVPGLFQGLANGGRAVLMEVCCGPQSILTEAVQQATGVATAASRCALWNACDVGSKEGLQLVKDRIRLEQPQLVWLSPPSSAYSPLQTMNQNTGAQAEALLQKRLEARRMYQGCCAVMHYAIQQGCHVVWEMSERCLAWRLPMIQKIREQYKLHDVVCKGCAVNRREPGSEKFFQQGWRFLTTHTRLAQSLDLPCRCPKSYQHARSTGQSKNDEDTYTTELSKRITKYLLEELSHHDVLREACGKTSLPEGFGLGESCVCNELKVPNLPEQRCLSCLGGSGILPGDYREAYEVQVSKVENPQAPEVSPRSSATNDSPVGGHEAYQVDEASEQTARELWSRKDFSMEACERLLKSLSLPNRGTKTRNIVGNNQAQYGTFGAYSYGSQYGVTKLTEQQPWVTRYLNSFLQKQLKPTARWSSFTVSCDNQLPVHRDVNNRQNFPNYLVGLGSYTGGELWVEGTSPEQPEATCPQVRADGSTLWGHTKPTRHRVVEFNPKVWHSSCKWEGTRIVITAFMTRGYDELGEEIQDWLQRNGFRGQPSGKTSSYAVDEALVIKGPPVWKPKFGTAQKKEEERIKRDLYLLHAATGHCSIRHLVQALRRRGAPQKVLDLAQKFVCPVCQEKARIQPQHVSSLEPLPPAFHTISADVGHWQDPRTHEHFQFLVVIDEYSRYRCARILTRGPKQQPSAATCLQYLRDGWTSYFGNPKCLRVDPAGSFRSQTLQEFCDRQDIYLDIIPGEAHWQIGVCEEAVKGLKETMHKMREDDPDTSADELLSTAVRIFNQRELIRGFSPLQLVFGRSADVVGRLSDATHRLPDELQLETAEGELARHVDRQVLAEKAHSEWQAKQRLLRAQHSRSRPAYDFRPGELVYFWRTQESGKHKNAPGSRKGRFLGLARVLATETRRGPEGENRPGSAVWLVRGRQLIKCAPEHLRHASTREELIEALTEENTTPWTYNRVVEQIGGNQYEDLTGTPAPTMTEWHRAQDPSQESQPTRRRIVSKRPAPEPVDEEMPTEESSGHLRRPRVQAPTSSEPSQEAHLCWWNMIPESEWSESEAVFWNEESAAVAVELDMPDSKRGWQKALNNLEGFFTGTLKKKSVEVSERRLTPAERAEFQAAKATEVRNFIASEAFKVLPPELQPSRSQAVGMRWVLTWKPLEGGG